MTADVVALERCPGCDAEVLPAPRVGRLLEVEPVWAGVWLAADGGRRKTIREALDGLAGHHEHRCPPPGQSSLFEVG